MSTTTAPSAEFADGGKPIAQARYLVDQFGNPIGSANPAPVSRGGVAIYTLASGALTVSGNSVDLAVGACTEIGIDIDITAESGTSPTIQFFWNRKGADGLYYPLWQTKVIAGTDTFPEKFSASIGAGMAYNQSLGLIGQLSWVLGGTTPSFTCSANVYGK